ncbi:unnamed protein product, partial [Pylaiella littoralis]
MSPRTQQWVINRMKLITWKPQPNISEAELFQVIPAGTSAAMTVKERGETFSNEGKMAAAARRHEAFTATTFLRWLTETADFSNSPAWLDQDIMDGPQLHGRAALGRCQESRHEGKSVPGIVNGALA